MRQSEKRTIRIRWVRSGIGFSHRAKEMIRSLGLRRLHEVVERPDTPQIRGLVSRIPHLVEVVIAPLAAPRARVPEYTIGPPEVALAVPAAPPPTFEEPEVPLAPSEVQEPAARRAPKKPVETPSEETPAAPKVAKAKKAAKAAAAEKGKTAKPAEAKKGKAVAVKDHKPAKKAKK